MIEPPGSVVGLTCTAFQTASGNSVSSLTQDTGSRNRNLDLQVERWLLAITVSL